MEDIYQSVLGKETTAHCVVVVVGGIAGGGMVSLPESAST